MSVVAYLRIMMLLMRKSKINVLPDDVVLIAFDFPRALEFADPQDKHRARFSMRERSRTPRRGEIPRTPVCSRCQALNRGGTLARYAED